MSKSLSRVTRALQVAGIEGEPVEVGQATTAQMAADPSSTLANLQRVLNGIVKPLVGAGDGRIVKLMGDGALVEFPSATNAITSAESIQRKLKGDPIKKATLVELF